MKPLRQRRSGPRFAAFVAAVALAALGAGAATAAPKTAPRPEALWQRFPLDPSPARAPRTQYRPSRTTGSNRASSQDRGGSSAIAIFAAVLGSVAAAFGLVVLALVLWTDARLGAAKAAAALRARRPTAASSRPRRRLGARTAAAEPAERSRIGEEVLRAVGTVIATAKKDATRVASARSGTRAIGARARSASSNGARSSGRPRGAHGFRGTQKPPGAEAEDAAVLKAKLKSHARADVAHHGRLKAKLADAQPPDQPPSPPLLYPQRSASGACRITLWRGYVKCCFVASIPAEGDSEESVIAASPYFTWWKSTPPPRSRPDVLSAFRALVEMLEFAGWKPIATGSEWFALELHGEVAR